MKKFISLLAAMALSFASVTAFAAPAAESDNIHVKLVADKATVAPGESFTLSAFISANGNADVSFDTVAMFGVMFDYDNFTWEVKEAGSFDVQDLIEEFGVVWAMDEKTMSYAADTACVEFTITADADAAEKSYDFSISEVFEDTAFQNGYTSYAVEKGNATLIGTTVEVKAGDDDEIKATGTTAANGANTTTYTFENSDAMAGKKVVMQNATMPTTGMTAKTRFVVSDGTRTQTFGSDIWSKLDVEGDGVIDVANVIFGIVVDAANTSTFTFNVQ